MNLFVTDPEVSKRLIRERRVKGIDRKDEVWEGVYVMSPPPNNEHQDIEGKIYLALALTIDFAGLGKVLTGVGITDRVDNWLKNFRCPDVSVFLNESTAINQGTHWLGGPDFAVEVISPKDRSRKKLAFYAKLGVKELLLVDRKPWALELYRLQDGALALVGKSDLSHPAVLVSAVVPLSFQLLEGDPRPSIVMNHSNGVQRWSA